MDEFEKVNETIETVDIDNKTEEIEPLEETTEAETESGTALEAEESAKAETKKPFILERTIIKAACIFLAALVVFGCFVIVNNLMTPSVEGIWILNRYYVKGSENQAQKIETTGKKAVYYNFTPDGEFISVSGTVTQKAKWTYVDKNGKSVTEKTNQIMLYNKGNETAGSQFKVNLEGNAFSDKKLSLEAGSEVTQVYEFVSYNGSEIPEYKMKADKNFKAVSELLGKWNDKTTQQKLTFNKDGSYVLEVGDSLVQKGNYTVDTKNKTITLSFVGNGEEGNTGALPYTLKGDKLTLVTYEFTKE